MADIRRMPSLPVARRLAALFASLALVPTSTVAGTHWRCELSADLVRLACRADASAPEAAPEAAPVAPVVAVVNGTRFPLDATRRWFVDLWSPPTDPDWLRLLARATICYRSTDCTVEVRDGATLAAR